MKSQTKYIELTVTCNITSITKEHRWTIRLLHYAAFTTIVQLIRFRTAVAAEPITIGDFCEIIMGAFQVCSRVTSVTQQHLVARLLENAAFAAFIKLVVIIKDYSICVIGIRRGVHDGI